MKRSATSSPRFLLFGVAVIAILTPVLVYYTIEGFRAGEVRFPSRLSHGRIVHKSTEPDAYWGSMAFYTAATAVVAIGAVSQGRKALRDLKKKNA